LGFHTDIYYMLGHHGWVQFSNTVSLNTHKEFALEILMTMAESLIPFGGRWTSGSLWVYLEITWFSKGSPGTSGCARRHIGRFFEYDHGRISPTKK
jgi:hypothetical protein